MQTKRIVRIWLLVGLVMLFLQIFIGGVTRLTGSGLSITKWDIVVGTIPPLNAQDWLEAFDLYKDTPQYEKINKGMSMSDFKFIYFWEYFHRLWARLMGFVFLIPFLLFVSKGWLSRELIKRLLILVGLTAIVAVFGWIMVASGLEDRPWVSAYKLTWHLSLALVVFCYMAWIVCDFVFRFDRSKTTFGRSFIVLFTLTCIQIMLGGIMSGAKAGLFYPTWPDMNGEMFPTVLLNENYWTISSFYEYDKNPFFPAFIQFCHRIMGYIVFVSGMYIGYRYLKEAGQKKWIGLTMLVLLTCQVVLGIWTLVSCKGEIPVFLGIVHQSFAILLLISVLLLVYVNTGTRNSGNYGH